MFSLSDITLRRVDHSDAELLLNWENNKENWRVSDRSEALSMHEIKSFIESQEDEFYQLNQIRFMIVEKSTSNCLGTVDLYEVNWDLDSAFVGILIADSKNRRNGVAHASLKLLEVIAVDELELNCLSARIQKDNLVSQKLFLKAGFNKKLDKLKSNSTEGMYIDFDIFKKWLNE